MAIVPKPIRFRKVYGPFSEDATDTCTVCRDSLNQNLSTNGVLGHKIFKANNEYYLGHFLCSDCLARCCDPNYFRNPVCPLCRIPILVLPANTPPIVVPRILLDAGISLDDLVELDEHSRWQILNNSRNVVQLMQAGLSFDAIVALDGGVRNLILDCSDQVVQLMNFRISFDEIISSLQI